MEANPPGFVRLASAHSPCLRVAVSCKRLLPSHLVVRIDSPRTRPRKASGCWSFCSFPSQWIYDHEANYPDSKPSCVFLHCRHVHRRSGIRANFQLKTTPLATWPYVEGGMPGLHMEWMALSMDLIKFIRQLFF